MLARSCLVFAVLSISSAMGANFPGQSANGLIGGSWVQSCDAAGATVQGTTLRANCRAAGGNFQASSLNLRTCGQPPTAGNQNGRLVCEGGGAPVGALGASRKTTMWTEQTGPTRITFPDLTTLAPSAGVGGNGAASASQPLVTRMVTLNPMGGNLVQRTVTGNLPNSAPSGGGGGVGDDDSGNAGGLHFNVQIGNGGGGNFVSAIVASGVNLRTGPSGKNSQVIRSLQPGTAIQVLCDRSWCQLANGGFVAKSFLSFGGSAKIAPTTPPNSKLALANVTGNFAGTWSLTASDGSKTLLTLFQSGSDVSGTMGDAPTILKLNGKASGNRLVAHWVTVSANGKTFDNGTTVELDLLGDGSTITFLGKNADGTDAGLTGPRVSN